MCRQTDFKTRDISHSIKDMNTQSIKIGLKKIQEISFSLIDSDNNAVEMNDMKIQYSTLTTIPEEGDEININASFKYLNDGKTLIHLEESFTFFTENLQKHITINKEEGEVSMEYDIMPLFLNIVYGTLRGIMAEKTRGTILEDYPLPICSTDNICSHNTIIIK